MLRPQKREGKSRHYDSGFAAWWSFCAALKTAALRLHLSRQGLKPQLFRDAYVAAEAATHKDRA
jgi:hypothetical protein